MADAVVVIQAGGDGTRLWPLSTTKRPKQFLKIGKYSFFQKTVRRAQVLKKKFNIRFVVLGNSRTSDLLLKQCREIGFTPDVILIQPCNRNTAPALIGVASYIEAAYGGDVPTCFMPCDHVFGDDEVVGRHLAEAIQLVEEKEFVSLVTKPEEYNSQYGYYFGSTVISDAHFVARPSLDVFEQMKEKELHPFWDCGVFVTTARFLLEKAAEEDAAIVQNCKEAVKQEVKSVLFSTFNPALYAALPSVPITTLVMQKLKKVGIVLLSTTWTDIGSWPSFLSWYFKGGWRG